MAIIGIFGLVVIQSQAISAGNESTIIGTVVKNVTEHAPADGAAFLIVRSDDGAQMIVTYSPGEAECKNTGALRVGFTIKAVQRVEVYGKAISAQAISTCESNSYYIKVLNEFDPLRRNPRGFSPGMNACENISASGRELRPEGQRGSTSQQGSSASTTDEWKVFQDVRYNFRFDYPAKWSIENQPDATRNLILKTEENNEIITITPRVSLTVMGISYCGAYPEDNRCEVLKTNSGSSVTINWDVDREANAMFSYPEGTYGESFTLHKINPHTKTIFRKILLTFKFLSVENPSEN